MKGSRVPTSRSPDGDPALLTPASGRRGVREPPSLPHRWRLAGGRTARPSSRPHTEALGLQQGVVSAQVSHEVPTRSGGPWRETGHVTTLCLLQGELGLPGPPGVPGLIVSTQIPRGWGRARDGGLWGEEQAVVPAGEAEKLSVPSGEAWGAGQASLDRRLREGSLAVWPQVGVPPSLSLLLHWFHEAECRAHDGQHVFIRAVCWLFYKEVWPGDSMPVQQVLPVQRQEVAGTGAETLGRAGNLQGPFSQSTDSGTKSWLCQPLAV